MHVTKPIDLTTLSHQLDAAGQGVLHGLGYTPTEVPGEGDVYTYDSLGVRLDLPPEAAPVVDAHDASTPHRTKAFEAQEDAERAALVAERALTDPAFAALADLTLGKQGV